MFNEAQMEFIGPNYRNGDVLRAVRQNLSALYSTPEGACPGDRSYGLDWSCLDYPLPVAQNMYTIEVMEKTEIYEPRAEVLGVDFKVSGDGNLTPVVTVSLRDPDELENGDGDEEDDDYV